LDIKSDIKIDFTVNLLMFGNKKKKEELIELTVAIAKV